jgi:hypothetical protein
VAVLRRKTVIVIGVGVRITASESRFGDSAVQHLGSDDAESRFFSPDHSSVTGESRFAWSESRFRSRFLGGQENTSPGRAPRAFPTDRPTDRRETERAVGGQIQYAVYVIRDTDTAAMVS